MHPLQRLRARPLVVIGACGALIVAATVADAARAASLDLVSGVPTFTPVDLMPDGPSMGDINVFTSTIAPAGSLVGVQTTIGVGVKAQTVQGALTFDLPDGQLAVAGVSELDRTPTGLLADRTYTRAVVGGTGAYAGVHGTVTSTRRPDGTVAQAFALTPPTGATGTLDMTSTTAVKQVDLGAVGSSPGDLTVIDQGVLQDAAGGTIGRLRGIQQAVSTTDGRVAQAQLVFTFADGELLVGGLSRQVLGTGLVEGTTFVRPVLGGTGRYAGAGGTLTTTPGPDGRYAQRFDLSGLGAAARRTVRLVVPASGQRGRNIDQPPAGASAGDQSAFASTLRDRGARRRIGTVRGVQTTVAVENGLQTVVSQLTYTVRGRGTLVVGGLSRFPTTGVTGTVRGALPVRPVIGGTGDFAGAHGIVRTVRSRDGGYRLTFSLAGAPSLKR